MGYEYLKQQIVHLGKDSVVLDLGAGRGQYRALFRESKYIGVDVEPHDGVALVADITKPLAIEPNSIDCVIVSNVLEHVPEPMAVLTHLKKVLKTDGMVLILVPFTIKIHQAPRDFLRYTHYMLRYLLQRSGFRNIEITKLGTIRDIRKGIMRGYFRTIQARLKSMVPNRYARFPLKVFIQTVEASMRGILGALDLLLDDNFRTKKDHWVLGYAAKACK